MEHVTPTEHGDRDAAGTIDAALVAEALAGDREAIGRIYDRYADRIHTMCAHMLSDRDEAADVCGEVFLVAFQRLGQLREPSRLRVWLFAIARHEVYRRTERRNRIELTEGVDEMDRLAASSWSDDTDDGDASSAGDLALLLRDASAGLDDRDRMVMELQLQGLDGDELAAALGTSTSTAYQHTHRMKERLERSIGAVLVARQGRADCDELDRLLAGWDGRFSVLWRKRVARHVDGCEVCERRRKAVPAMLLGGVAAAAPMLGASAVSAAPASVRDRVVRDARVGSSGGAGWRRDGFPPAAGSGRTRLLVAVAALVVLLSLVLGAWWLLGDDGTEVVTAGDDAVSILAPSTTTMPPTSSTTTIPATVVPDTVAPELPTTVPPVPGVLPPGPSGPGGAAPPGEELPTPEEPSGPPASEPPAAPPDTAPPAGPSVSIRFAPEPVFHPTPGFPECGASEAFRIDAPSAASVTLRWAWSTRRGSVALTRVGAEWIGVLEVPGDVPGPLVITAHARDAAGHEGVSATLTRTVAPCITPG
jgi:RNA polymerase sigma factor (sigma-70 family)